MTTEAFLQIPVEKLSTYKTNVIPFRLEKDGIICGQVSKILDQQDPIKFGANIFRCIIEVKSDCEDYVFAAMAKENKKLLG